MKRREFITLLGATAAWPPWAKAQQGAMPVIGFLNSRGADGAAYLVSGFRRGLAEAGFVEGQSVAIDYRSAEGQAGRMPAILEEFVRREAAVIVAAGSVAALAAKAATTSIPIVFAGGSDPVALGLVSSLNRPSGNITGVTIISHLIGAKRLEALRMLVPNATSIAVLVEPANPSTPTLVDQTNAAARALGLQTVVHTATTAPSLEAAFAAMAQQKMSALFVGGGPILGDMRAQVTALAARHSLPAVYSLREYVDVGGLMSYGSDFVDSYRQVGEYAGRILKGEKPANLPVQQPTKFELVLNLKAARALSLTIPDKLLALADEVIE
jgi:putative tryptophan/tyrosine transport system substrate-binding protein